MSLNALYQQIILEHNRNPRNFGELDESKVSTFYDNPSCGDEIRLQIAVEADRVAKIRFTGRGCAISMASASLMTEAIEGKTLDEARQFAKSFQNFMSDEGEVTIELEDLEALEGVKKFPVRVKCATLAWTALNDLLEKHGQ